jgi:hypothetical protein
VWPVNLGSRLVRQMCYRIPFLKFLHMSPALFRIWLSRTLLFALPLLAIGIWDSFEEGFTAFAACLCALVLVSSTTYVSVLVLKSILDWEGHPPVDC